MILLMNGMICWPIKWFVYHDVLQITQNASFNLFRKLLFTNMWISMERSAIRQWNLEATKIALLSITWNNKKKFEFGPNYAGFCLDGHISCHVFLPTWLFVESNCIVPTNHICIQQQLTIDKRTLNYNIIREGGKECWYFNFCNILWSPSCNTSWLPATAKHDWH